MPKTKKFRGDVSALVMTVSVWCTERHFIGMTCMSKRLGCILENQLYLLFFLLGVEIA